MAANRGGNDAFFSFGTDFPQVAQQILATARELVPKLEGVLGQRGNIGAGLFDQLVKHAQTAQEQTIASVRKTAQEIKAILASGGTVPAGGLLGEATKASTAQAHQLVENVRREIARLPAAMQTALGPAVPRLLETLTAGVGQNVARAVADVQRQLGVPGGLQPGAFQYLTKQALTQNSGNLEAQKNQARYLLNELNTGGKLTAPASARIYAKTNPYISAAAGGQLAITDPDDASRRVALKRNGELYTNQAAAQKVLIETEQRVITELGGTIAPLHDHANETRRIAAEQRLYRETIREARAGLAVQVPGRSNQLLNSRGQLIGINEATAGARVIPPNSLTAVQAEQAFERQRQQEAQRAQQAAARAQAVAAREAAAAERAAPKGYAQAAVSGFFGRGFNPSQRGSIDLKHGLENLISTQTTLARYALGGAGIYAAINLVQSLKAEYADFIDSQTDVNIALGKGSKAGNEYVQSLEGISRLAGSNVGEALDSAARGIRAFGDAGDTTKRGQNKQVGEDVARAAGQLSVIARKDLKDAAGDIIAIGEAFGLTASNLQQVNDAIAGAKQLGGDPNQISQGLANIGVTAKEAGFSLNETANIISLVQARTDQSGQAVATRLSKIISIFGTGGNQAFLRQLGIDTTQSPREQLLGAGGVADVYQQSSKSQQAAIRSRLGGTANLRELIVLLDEHNRSLLANATANGSAGKGQQEFNRRIGDFTGLLKKLTGDIKNIEVNLVNSGLFDAFGFALQALEPGLHLLGEVLGIFNSLPRPMRTVLALFLEIAAAQRLIGAARKLGFLPGAGDVATRGPLRGRGAGATAVGIGAEGLAYEIAPGVLPGSRRTPIGYRSLGTAGGGARALGSALNTLAFADPAVASERFRAAGRTLVQSLAPVGAGFRTLGGQLGGLARQAKGFAGSLGGVLTIFALGATFAVELNRSVTQNLKNIDATHEVIQRSVEQTPEALRQHAADLKTQAQKDRKGASGILGTLGDFFTGSHAGSDANRAENFAKANENAAKAIEDATKKAAQGRVGEAASVFDLSSADGITTGLKTLQDEGRSATTQFDALSVAINRLGTTADSASRRLTPLESAKFGAALGPRIGKDIDLLKEIYEGKGGTLNHIRSQLLGQVDQSKLQADTQQAVADFTAAGGDPTTQQGQKDLTDFLTNSLSADLVGLDEETKKEVIKGILASIRGTLGGSKDKKAADANFEALLAQTIQQSQAKAQEQGLTAGLGGGSQAQVQADAYLKNLKQRKAEIEAKINDGQVLTDAQKQEFEQVNVAIQEATLAQIDAKVNSLATQGALIESLYGGDQHRVLAEHLKTLRAQLAITTDKDKRAQKQAEINQVLDQQLQQSFADKQTAYFFGDKSNPFTITGDPTSQRQQIESQIESARAKLADDQKGHYRTLTAGKAGKKIDNSALIAAKEIEKKNLEEQQKEVQRQIDTASAQSRDDPRSEERMLKLMQRKAQIDAALSDTNKSLGALRKTDGTTVGAIEADIQLIKASKEQTRADIIALANLQDQLRLAKLDAADVSRQLSIDITDPVAVARDAVKTARDKLNSDKKAGKDQDTLNADALALANAEQSAQKTAFDARLQHEQTLYGLQQISGAKYIQFLQGQEATLRSQLATMHKGQRGYQQRLDELYQVQQALKDANNQAQGQFNLGKIRVPTPYEVRRLVASQAEGVRGLTNTISAINTTNTITINGADTAMVRQLLVQLLGADQIRRVGASGRRT